MSFRWRNVASVEDQKLWYGTKVGWIVWKKFLGTYLLLFCAGGDVEDMRHIRDTVWTDAAGRTSLAHLMLSTRFLKEDYLLVAYKSSNFLNL